MDDRGWWVWFRDDVMNPYLKVLDGKVDTALVVSNELAVDLGDKSAGALESVNQAQDEFVARRDKVVQRAAGDMVAVVDKTLDELNKALESAATAYKGDDDGNIVMAVDTGTSNAGAALKAALFEAAQEADEGVTEDLKSMNASATELYWAADRVTEAATQEMTQLERARDGLAKGLFSGTAGLTEGGGEAAATTAARGEGDTDGGTLTSVR